MERFNSIWKVDGGRWQRLPSIEESDCRCSVIYADVVRDGESFKAAETVHAFFCALNPNYKAWVDEQRASAEQARERVVDSHLIDLIRLICRAGEPSRTHVTMTKDTMIGMLRTAFERGVNSVAPGG